MRTSYRKDLNPKFEFIYATRIQSLPYSYENYDIYVLLNEEVLTHFKLVYHIKKDSFVVSYMHSSNLFPNFDGGHLTRIKFLGKNSYYFM